MLGVGDRRGGVRSGGELHRDVPTIDYQRAVVVVGEDPRHVGVVEGRPADQYREQLPFVPSGVEAAIEHDVDVVAKFLKEDGADHIGRILQQV